MMANNIKRPRKADIDDPTGEFDQMPRLKENLTFSSTLVGLRMMGAQFPNNERTLRREKVLRVFKINTVQDDNAMFLDDYLCQLCNHGIYFQTRQLIDPNVYWSVIPNIGSILKGLSQGRKEVLSLLHPWRYKEIMMVPLEKKALRFSPLDMRFHLRDLIG